MNVSYLFKKLVRYPYVVVFIILTITVYFAIEAKEGLFTKNGTIIIDSSIEPVMARESGNYQFYLKMKETFFKKDTIIVALKPKTFNLEFLNKLDKLQNDIKENVRGVNSIVSILNTPNLNGSCAGKSYFYEENAGSVCKSVLEETNSKLSCINGNMPIIEDNLEENLDFSLDEDFESNDTDEPSTKDNNFICTKAISQQSYIKTINLANNTINNIVSNISIDKFMQKDIISIDGKTTAFIVEFKDNIQARDKDIQNSIETILNKYKNNQQIVAYAGESRQQFEATEILISDMKNIFPLSLVLMIITLYISFKSYRSIFVTLSTIIIGTIWTFGIFANLKETLNLVSMIIPILLLAIGSAYVIHILNFYYSNTKKSTDIQIILDKTIEHITLPMLITALTTLSGFAALMLSPIPAVSQMGLYSCIGIASIILLSLTFVPSILYLLPLPKKAEIKNKNHTILDTLLQKKSILIKNNAKKFINIWLFILIFFLVGSLNISFDSVSNNFNKDLEISKDLKFIQQNLAGIRNIKIVFSGEELQTAKTILGLDKVNKFLLDTNGKVSKIKNLRIDKIYSIVDYLEFHRKGLDNLKSKEVVQFFKDFKKQNGSKFLSDDEQYLQFDIRLTGQGSASSIVLKEALVIELNKHLSHLTYKFTGSEILTSESVENIAKSQIQSLAMALVIIFLILSVLFFSFKMGFLALYPNIAAIIVFFGLLGMFNIPIGITVSVIAAIALGIGVDDTIHFLINYNNTIKETRDEKLSSLMTLQLVGKPMVYTTITLVLGFSVFVLSNMTSQVLFGVLTVFTLIICLFTDLNLLPSIMAETKLITMWDYLTLKYDDKFISKISLFNHMTVKETKLATLMAYTADLKNDEKFLNQGDKGNEMYVILDGSIQIYLEKDNDNIVLTELKQGDVFGEMGLFRNALRSASAKSIGKTKLLVLNDNILTNIQNRYPEIGAKLFRNLALNLVNSINKTNKLILSKNIKLTNLNLDNKSNAYSSIFNNLCEKDIMWLNNNLNIEYLQKNEVLKSIGDIGDISDSMAIVVDGSFDIILKNGNTVAVIGANDIIGERTLLDDSAINKRYATIKARETTIVMIINKKIYNTIMSKHYKIASTLNYNIVCLLSDRLQNNNKIIYS